MHSVRKCCIFAPAIERTAFCALLGSSIKTYTGYKIWQAQVINEDPENGRKGAFWGVAKKRTLNILQTTMINYSIVMRSVNANLLEINQAKSRINQAKKEGKTNVDLNAPTTPDNTPGGSTPGGSSTGQTGSEGQGSESRRRRRVRPTLTSTPQPLRIIRQAVLPQVVQAPVRPAAKAKALNQPAALLARTILATALNSPRIDWLGY